MVLVHSAGLSTFFGVCASVKRKKDAALEACTPDANYTPIHELIDRWIVGFALGSGETDDIVFHKDFSICETERLLLWGKETLSI